MDVQRFSLEAGRTMYSISRNRGQNPLGDEVYFATPESAILSIFHVRGDNWSNRELEDEPIYLKGYKLLQSFEGIERSTPALMTAIRLGDRDEQTYLQRVSEACSGHPNGISYVTIPVILRDDTAVDPIMGEVLLVDSYGDIDQVYSFVFCRSDVLIQSRNLKLDINGLMQMVHRFRLKHREAEGEELMVPRCKQIIRYFLTYEPARILEAIPIEVPNTDPASQLLPGTNLSMMPSPEGYGNSWVQPLPATAVGSPVFQVSASSGDRDAFAGVPNDVVVEIALRYDLDSVQRMCLSSSRFNRLICDNENYWQKRFSLEQPGDEAYENADAERKSWVNPRTGRSEVQSWKVYYRSTYRPTAEDMIGKIRLGLSTAQILLLLHAMCTKQHDPSLNDTYSMYAIAELISQQTGIPLTARDMRPTRVDTHFFPPRSDTPYQAADAVGAALVANRARLFQLLVAILGSRPEIMMPGGLDGRMGRMNITKRGAFFQETVPIRRDALEYVFRGTPFNPNKMNSQDRARLWEYERLALVRLLELTDPSIEPVYPRK